MEERTCNVRVEKTFKKKKLFTKKNARIASNFLRGPNDAHKKRRSKRGFLKSKLKH